MLSPLGRITFLDHIKKTKIKNHQQVVSAKFYIRKTSQNIGI